MQIKTPVRSSDHELLIVLAVGVRLVLMHVRGHRVTEIQESLMVKTTMKMVMIFMNTNHDE